MTQCCYTPMLYYWDNFQSVRLTTQLRWLESNHSRVLHQLRVVKTDLFDLLATSTKSRMLSGYALQFTQFYSIPVNSVHISIYSVGAHSNLLSTHSNLISTHSYLFRYAFDQPYAIILITHQSTQQWLVGRILQQEWMRFESWVDQSLDLIH